MSDTELSIKKEYRDALMLLGAAVTDAACAAQVTVDHFGDYDKTGILVIIRHGLLQAEDYMTTLFENETEETKHDQKT